MSYCLNTMSLPHPEVVLSFHNVHPATGIGSEILYSIYTYYYILYYFIIIYSIYIYYYILYYFIIIYSIYNILYIYISLLYITYYIYIYIYIYIYTSIMTGKGR